MAYSFRRRWDFDSAMRLLTTTDLLFADDDTTDFGEAIAAALSGGVEVNSAILDTLGTSASVRIGTAGVGDPIGTEDPGVINLANPAEPARNGYLVPSEFGGISIAASNEAAPTARVAVVIVSDQVTIDAILAVSDDIVLYANSGGAETARISAGTGEIESPTIQALADRISALENSVVERDEALVRAFSGDIQPAGAVDGDLWGRSDPA